ncbi:MAG: S-adenosylmethionine:tRNA ribosyltransferase-isomerase, partial [Pseudomonadota bacterium]
MDGAPHRVRADGEAVDDYDFALPEDRIALRPAVPRDSARLLQCTADGALSDHHVRDLPAILRKGDRLVVNNSRVIPARLIGERVREGISAKVELTLTERVEGGAWRALAKPAKKLLAGDRLVFGGGEGVGATVVSRDGAHVTVHFDGDPLGAGVMPLPPYIAAKRPADRQDESDYQTVYA